MKLSKEFLRILETGHICGLETVNEAIDNILLHYNCNPLEIQYADKLISSTELEAKQLLDSRIVDIVPKPTIDKWEEEELKFFESQMQ
jgi:hypothetical protein